jgi:hypothetical protein
MPDYVLTQDGVLETANGKSRVYKGGTVSLTEQEHRANAQLFVEQPAPEPAKAPEPPLAEVMKPVRHTPKAEPAKAPEKKPAAKPLAPWKPTGHKR